MGEGCTTGKNGRRRRRPTRRTTLQALTSLVAALLLLAVLPMRSEAWIPPDPAEWQKVPFTVETYVDDFTYMAPDSSGIVREFRACEHLTFAVLDSAFALEGPGEYLPPVTHRVRIGRSTVDTGGLSILAAVAAWERVGDEVLTWGTAPSGKPFVAYGVYLGRWEGENTGNIRARCDDLEEVAGARAASQLETLEIWAPVPNQNPLAAFQYQISDTNPRQVTFTNRSTDPDNDADELTFQWAFGDGTTSNQRNPVKTYAADGDYRVRLLAFDGEGGSAEHIQIVEVGGPILEGAIFPFPTGDSIIKEDEVVDVRLRVENDGSAPLTDVTVSSVAVTATDDEGTGVATIERKPGGETLIGSLGIAADGTDLDFEDYRVTAKTAGTVQVAMTVQAKLPDGEPVQAVITWDLEIRPAPLKVQLTARVPRANPSPAPGAPFEFLLNDNEHDNRFEVEVEVTNRGDETVESIDFLDPAAPIDLDSLLVDDEGNPIPGVAIEPLDDPAPDLPDDDLDPGESTSRTYRFEGFEKAHATLSTIVQGRMGDEAVSGRGTVEVKVLTDVLVEFGMKTSRPSYRAGEPVRLEGILENVSEDSTVGVAVYPETEGNAGNGNVFPATGSGETPDAPIGFVLEPGDDPIDLNALLVTTELEVASDAIVSWKVLAWEHVTDPETGRLEKLPVGDTQIRYLTRGGLSDSVTVRLPPEARLPDVVGGECAWAYVGCGVLVGLERLARSSYDLARLAGNTLVDFGNQELRLLAWTGQMLAEVSLALQADPLARRRLIEEIKVDAQALIDAGAITAGQVGDLGLAVAQGLGEFIDTWVGLYETGDLEQIQFELGRIAGENPDVLFSAFVVSKAAVKSLKDISSPQAAARRALDAKRSARQATLPERLASAERTAARGGTPVSEASVFDAGDDLSKMDQADYFAADPRDVDTLANVAEAHQVSISYGARVGEIADLIRRGEAWPTPRELTVSPIGDIDIEYLGYPERRRNYADLVSPPADIGLTFTSVNGDCCFHPGSAEVAAAAKKWVRQTYPSLDVATAQRVATQLHRRVDEFVANYQRFIEFSRARPGTYEVEVGTVDPTSYLLGGRGTWKQVFDERMVRLTPLTEGEFGPLPPGRLYPEGSQWPTWGTGNKPIRLYWEMEFDALGNGDYRPMTHGLEILSVQNADGTVITDVAKRAAIYEDLQRSINMHNGDLHDFVAGGDNQKLLEYARRNDTAVSIGPDGRARASYYEVDRAIRPGGPNASKRVEDAVGDFLMMTGVPAKWRAPIAGIAALDASDLFTLLGQGYSLPLLFLPASLHLFAAGLADVQVPDRYERGGTNVRGDGDGGLEVYDPAGGSTSRFRVAGVGDGRWRPISAEDALAPGEEPDLLEISPMTSVVVAEAGTTTIEVSEPGSMGLEASTDWFRPGDRIVIDPGGPNEERATVTALGSLVLATPLERSHQPGETVIRDIPANGDPTDPTDPTDPGGPGDPTDPADGPDVGSGELVRTGSSPATVALVGLALLVLGLLTRRAGRRAGVSAR